jgi:hypothetical protein
MSAVKAATSSGGARDLALGRAMLPKHKTGKPLGNSGPLPDALNAGSAAGGAYQFPEAASFRISFPGVRSDTARRRRAFSASGSFNRLTKSLFSRPDFWRTDNTYTSSRRSIGSLPPPIGPAAPARRPAAAWRRFPRAYGAFCPYQNPPQSFKSDTSWRITFRGQTIRASHGGCCGRSGLRGATACRV